MSDVIKEYLDTVSEQIRWKKARKLLTAELEAHIYDQKMRYLTSGMNEEDASQKAVRDMGDPIETGTELDRIHRPKPDIKAVIFLCVAVTAASVVKLVAGCIADVGTVWIDDSITYGILTLIAAILAAAVYYIDYTIFLKRPAVIFFGTILVMTVMTALVIQNLISPLPLRYLMLLLFPLSLAALIYSVHNIGVKGAVLCGLGFGYQVFLAMLVLRRCQSAPFVFFCGSVILLFSVGCGLFSREKKFLCAAVILGLIIFTAVGAIFILYAVYDFKNEALRYYFGYPELLGRIVSEAKLFGASGLTEEWMMEKYGISFNNLYHQSSYSYVILNGYGWAAFALTKLPIIVFCAYSYYRSARQTSQLGRIISLTVVTQIAVKSLLLWTTPLICAELTGYGEAFVPVSGLLFDVPLTALMLSAFRTDNITRYIRTPSFFQAVY